MLGVFTVGLVLGGVLSASVLTLLSGLVTPLPPLHVVVVAFAAAGVLRDAGVLRFPLPQNVRQIPQEVLRRHLVRGSLQFGFELGTGVRTYVSSTAPYVLALALLLISPGWGHAILAGIGFGLGRAATPLARLASGAGEAWDVVLGRRLRVLTVACCGLLLVLAVLLSLAA